MSARSSAVMAAALLLAVAGAGCSRGGEPTTAAPPPVSVTVVRPERHTIARTTALPAAIEAYEQAPLYAKVAGYVADIAVDIGARVDEGQVLVTLEMPEMTQQYAQAESLLAERLAERLKAAAAGKLAQQELVRSRTLRAQDAITAQDLDRAVAEAAHAAAERSVVEAQMEGAEQRVAELRALMGYGTLRAPFAGIVIRRLVDRGAFVPAATSNSAARPLLVVARVDRVRVVVEAPESDVPFLAIARPAVLQIGAITDRRFSGEITRVAGALDPSSRTMRAEVDIANPNGVLLPGMYGTLVIDLEAHSDALTVPEAAVRTEKAATIVYVLDGDHAVARTVKTGFTAEHRIEILDGLDETATVITPASSVTDGTPVRASRHPEPPASGQNL